MPNDTYKYGNKDTKQKKVRLSLRTGGLPDIR